METFETKLTETLRQMGYEYNECDFPREDEDLKKQIAKQRKKLTSEQREEAVRICEMFFDNTRTLDISDVVAPVIKVKNIIAVPHLATKKMAYVMFNAETMIAKRFDEMRIGGEFNVNVEYVGTYNGGKRVPADFNEKKALDYCRVVIEFELY